MAGVTIRDFMEISHRLLDRFGPAKDRISYREFSGKRQLIEAYNSLLFVELCLKAYHILRQTSYENINEETLAEAIIRYHRERKTKIYDVWEKEKMFYTTLEEYFRKDKDLVGVFYHGLTWGVDVCAYDILRNLKDCYMMYIINDWEDLESVMESSTFMMVGNRTLAGAVFWLPNVGLFRAKMLDLKSPRIDKKVLEEELYGVLSMLKDIIIENIEYERMPEKEEDIELFEEYLNYV